MVLKTCCCGCSLETGTKIIAILAIVGGCVSLISLAFPQQALFTVQGETTEVSSTIIAIKVVIGLITIILAALLLVAISQKNPVFLLPWLIVFVIGKIAGSIYVIYIVVILFSAGQHSAIAGGIILGILIPALALVIYFWLVVFSYYKELKSAFPNHAQQRNQNV